MFSGLSRCFSFIAHVMAHKLIPKRDLPDNSHSKKRKKRARERDTRRERYLSLVKGTRRGAATGTGGKSKMKQGEKKKGSSGFGAD